MRTIILSALVAMLISVLLDGGLSQSPFNGATLVTWGLLALIWWGVVSRRRQGYSSRDDREGAPDAARNRTADDEDEVEAFGLFGTSQESSNTEKAVLHRLPWDVVRRGNVLGRFRNTPIAEWIETSDGRRAEYAGTTIMPLPEDCTGLEYPGRRELVLPPGLIYLIHQNS
ncbi:MAG: hypothetical protein HQL82_02085 [Magnetococcales bacterium]|nr:hypothetical protein [Magnetococcales bacterium]